LDILSRDEVARLHDASNRGQHDLLRRCALAVLTTGSESDDPRAASLRYPDFDIEVLQQDRGIKIEIKGAPATAFVDGEIIRGIAENLFAVVRDIAYNANEIHGSKKFDLATSAGMTSAVFEILRNARVMRSYQDPNLVVCWGGHSINREEYLYTKRVGYELGLRGLDICTGCGPGAMKGPMKGAAIGHAKQRIGGRYLGFTEPGIIAAEPPNPIVNELVILPDIEKRLEAFVRAGHGIIVFPGGVGTAEEILYILGILLHPDNVGLPFPLVFTGPKSAEEYFRRIDEFIGETLGVEAQKHYKIIIDDPESVARELKSGLQLVRDFRKEKHDAYNFNWLLRIDSEFQQRFRPTHENMRNLHLQKNQPSHLLAANLRRAFSGLVAGNVKADGIREIEKHGCFEIHGESVIMGPVDALLSSFAAQNRMKLSGKKYNPCYRIVDERGQ
jgi:predicted Rossmann-fold nucleotide-binding protein